MTRAIARASVALALGVAMTGCPRSPGSRAPHGDGDTAANGRADGSGRGSASESAPTIDGTRMLGLLGALADDGLGGRYTLASQDIDRAAEMLAAAYRDAGIAPVGERHRVTYPVITGVREREPTALSITTARARTPIEVPATAVVPRSASASGTATGEVVFVGYGVRSKAGADGKSTYDDLAGVDVRGKIALCLAELPATPELESMFDVLQAKAVAFEAEVAPLRAKKDAAAMTRAHVALRKELARTFAPWMRGRKLPRTFTAAPADPFATVDVRGIVDALQVVSDELPGPQFDMRSARLRVKVDRLAEAGAVGVILVQGPRTYVGESARSKDALPELAKSRPGIEAAKLPVVQMSWHEADARFRIPSSGGGKRLSAMQARIDTKLVPQSRAIVGTTATLKVALEPTSVQVPNVLAQIPGSDRADEIVVIGAHFDHIGRDGNGQCHTVPGDAEKDGICNGADDNASGTAMVVEVARALAAAGVKPRRTLVFAHFSGEEIGLHGSKALAESPPQVGPFAKGKVVAMINLDMVGRMDERGLAIGGLGSSAAWMPLLDEVGPHGLPVLYDRAITTRSDHASFYRKQVPVLFFFTHLHDDYHRPGDETAGINGAAMTKIAELVADLLGKLGDGREVPFAEPKHPEEGLVGALPGTNPATVEKRVGLPDAEAAPASAM